MYDFFRAHNSYYTIGYIVMEYFSAPDCEKGDTELVARAVEWLIRVPAPSNVPRPSVEVPLFILFTSTGHLIAPTTVAVMNYKIT